MIWVRVSQKALHWHRKGLRRNSRAEKSWTLLKAKDILEDYTSMAIAVYHLVLSTKNCFKFRPSNLLLAIYREQILQSNCNIWQTA